MKDRPTSASEDHGAARRRAALAAADRSNDQEGLPPASPFAQALDASYIDGTLTAAQIAERLRGHYTKSAG